MSMDSFLMHYGVAGQKWGIRRYQNEDGTLTEEGRIRYLQSLDKNRREAYESLSPENQRSFDRELASGKDFDEAFRAGMQKERKAAYRKQILGRVGSFIAGYGTSVAGGVAVIKGRSTLGLMLGAIGKGTMIGSVIGGIADSVKNKVAKDNTNNLDFDKLFGTDKEKRKKISG